MYGFVIRGTAGTAHSDNQVDSIPLLRSSKVARIYKCGTTNRELHTLIFTCLDLKSIYKKSQITMASHDNLRD